MLARLRGFVVCSLLAWCLGCASGGQVLSTQDAQRAALEYEAASALFEQDPEAGTEALTEFVGDWPSSRVADDAALQIAEYALSQRDAEKAKHFLHWIVKARSESDRAQRANLLLAQIEIEQGDFKMGYQRASQLNFEQLSREEQDTAFRLLTDFDVWREDAAAELFWRAKWHALTDDVDTRLEQEDAIRALLKGPLANYDFQILAEHLQEFSLADHLALFAAERALSLDDIKKAERSLQWLASRELSPELLGMYAALQQEILFQQEGGVTRELPAPLSSLEVQPLPDLSGLSGTIGVILPLSGKWKRFGEESLKGILIATGMFEYVDPQDVTETDEFRPGLRLVVRDSAGSPVQAAAAVRELSEIEDVVVLIGPLHHKAAEAAAEVAERLEIPLLTLTSREDVSRDRPHAFRLGMTQNSRTEALAELLESELGLGRIAILYPKDQYGKRLKNLFWDAIDTHGGEVVGVASYAPDATDFADGIRSLVGYTLLTHEEKFLLEERRHFRNRSKRLPLEEAIALRSAMDVLTTMQGEAIPPIVDFDAVFIADSYEKVVLIAPQLAFHDVTDIRLLGAGGWNHSDLLSMGRKHVRGAIFAEAFYSEYPHPAVTHFVQRYHSGYDGEVSQFSAQSYDATNLVLAQLARGRDTREGITRGLLRVRDYAGASGSMNIQPDGNARKHPFLLEVRWGRILPLKTP